MLDKNNASQLLLTYKTNSDHFDDGLSVIFFHTKVNITFLILTYGASKMAKRRADYFKITTF